MPAGLPCGMPGMGLVMDGAMQQAPQRGRHANPGAGGVVEGKSGASCMARLSAQVAGMGEGA